MSGISRTYFAGLPSISIDSVDSSSWSSSILANPISPRQRFTLASGSVINGPALVGKGMSVTTAPCAFARRWRTRLCEARWRQPAATTLVLQTSAHRQPRWQRLAAHCAVPQPTNQPAGDRAEVQSRALAQAGSPHRRGRRQTAPSFPAPAYRPLKSTTVIVVSPALISEMSSLSCCGPDRRQLHLALASG